jgi:hypothetical protein
VGKRWVMDDGASCRRGGGELIEEQGTSDFDV